MTRTIFRNLRKTFFFSQTLATLFVFVTHTQAAIPTPLLPGSETVHSTQLVQITPDSKKILLVNQDGAFFVSPIDGSNLEPIVNPKGEQVWVLGQNLESPLAITSDSKTVFFSGRVGAQNALFQASLDTAKIEKKLFDIERPFDRITLSSDDKLLHIFSAQRHSILDLTTGNEKLISVTSIGDQAKITADFKSVVFLTPELTNAEPNFSRNFRDILKSYDWENNITENLEISVNRFAKNPFRLSADSNYVLAPTADPIQGNTLKAISIHGHHAIPIYPSQGENYTADYSAFGFIPHPTNAGEWLVVFVTSAGGTAAKIWFYDLATRELRNAPADESFGQGRLEDLTLTADSKNILYKKTQFTGEPQVVPEEPSAPPISVTKTYSVGINTGQSAKLVSSELFSHFSMTPIYTSLPNGKGVIFVSDGVHFPKNSIVYSSFNGKNFVRLSFEFPSIVFKKDSEVAKLMLSPDSKYLIFVVKDPEGLHPYSLLIENDV